MASKKDSVLRGAKLVKKAIEVGKSGPLASPEPIEPPSLAKKLKLPNGESVSPGLKELLATDVGWIAIDYDDEEAEIEAISIEEIVEEHFGEEAVAAFGEAYEMLTEDCVAFGAELGRPACLYAGTPDDAGEYPVLEFSYEGGVAKIGGFVPFDVWVAQQLGALERGKEIGDVPPEYVAVRDGLAQSNGDGRVVFTPKAGEAAPKDDEDEDEDEDETSS